MKFSRTLAALTAAAMAVSSLAVVASAEEAATTRTDEEYFELIKTVASVSATLTVNELAPDTAGGFAAFYMQNNGGDWAWLAGADDEATEDVNEDPTVKLTGAGEYEVKWENVQDVITVTKGSVSLSKLKAPAEEWESYPSFGIQVGSDGIVAAGDEGKVDAKVTNVVITFTDGSTMSFDGFDVAGDLLGKQEEWGLAGNNVMFNMADLIKAGTIVEAPADDEDDEEVPGDSEEVPGDSEEVPGGDEGDDENTGDEGDDENVGGDDEDETPGESSGEPTNPDTGVALVVVPAALAAAALATSGIALKKRSK